MSSKIEAITSETHKIKSRINEKSALVALSGDQEGNFVELLMALTFLQVKENFAS